MIPSDFIFHILKSSEIISKLNLLELLKYRLLHILKMKAVIKTINVASIKAAETVLYFIKLTKQYDYPDITYSNEDDCYMSYQKIRISLLLGEILFIKCWILAKSLVFKKHLPTWEHAQYICYTKKAGHKTMYRKI